ncbi:MAG: SPOR domain-containing protein [Deltaproteobacteria bacterium]|nr:SPOR domain-containing protein [Deltaproteobacteria bacterium]
MKTYQYADPGQGQTAVNDSGPRADLKKADELLAQEITFFDSCRVRSLGGQVTERSSQKGRIQLVLSQNSELNRPSEKIRPPEPAPAGPAGPAVNQPLVILKPEAVRPVQPAGLRKPSAPQDRPAKPEPPWLNSVKWLTRLFFSLVFLVWIFILGVLVGRGSLWDNPASPLPGPAPMTGVPPEVTETDPLLAEYLLPPPSRPAARPAAAADYPYPAAAGYADPGEAWNRLEETGALDTAGQLIPEAEEPGTAALIDLNTPPKPAVSPAGSFRSLRPDARTEIVTSSVLRKPASVTAASGTAAQNPPALTRPAASAIQPSYAQPPAAIQPAPPSQPPPSQAQAQAQTQDEYWPAKPQGQGSFTVQVAAAKTDQEARQIAAKFQNSKQPAYFYRNSRGQYPVRVGRYRTMTEAETAKIALAAAGAKLPYVSRLNP